MVTWGHLLGVPASYPLSPQSFQGSPGVRGPSRGRVSTLTTTSRSHYPFVCVDNGLTRGLNQHLLVLLFAMAQLCLLGALSVAPVSLMACPFVLGPQYGPAPAVGAAICPRGLAPFTGDWDSKPRSGVGPSEPSPISFHLRQPARGPGSSFWQHLPICPRGSREGARARASRSAQTRRHQQILLSGLVRLERGLCRGRDPVL